MANGCLGLPILEISKDPEEAHRVEVGFETRLWLQYHEYLHTLTIAKEKTATLENDPRIQALNGRLISQGSAAVSFQLYLLVMWWLWRANEVGVATADSDLELFLESTDIAAFFAQWVYGAEPSETISLTDKVKIVPIEEMFDCGDKEEIYRSNWRGKSSIVHLPSTALLTEMKIEKFAPAGPSETVHAVQGTLQEIALLLNVLPDICCVLGFSTSYMPSNVPFGPFGGRGAGHTIGDIRPNRNGSNLTAECSLPLRKLISGFGNLPDNWKERVTRSIARLSQSKSRIDANDKALDLGIALEMVLLHSEHKAGELPGQLHNHFRARGAWLIGESYEDRRHFYKALGEIYSNRSQVAHNGVLSKPKGADYSTQREQFLDHQAIAEKILEKLIVEGPPEDWCALVLGERA